MIAPVRTVSRRVTITLYLIPYERLPAVILLMSWNVMAADRVLVHGHRGARGAMPENTLPAFEYAIRAGVDVLELDLAVTKDNVLVVSHDPSLNPVICKDAPKATRHSYAHACGGEAIRLRSVEESAVPEADSRSGNEDSHPG